MSALVQVTLQCDGPGDGVVCAATYIASTGPHVSRARVEAQRFGWTVTARKQDRCPAHPVYRPDSGRGGVSIRLYDSGGRLLYVTFTHGTPAERIRGLRTSRRHGVWWPLVDPRRTIVERIPPNLDAAAEKDTIVRREKPRYFRDENGNQPYLHVRKQVPPALWGTPLSRLQDRRGGAS